MSETYEQTFCLQVPCSTRNLAMIRDFVTRVSEQTGLDDKQRNGLELAVDEACANVIEHAYGHDVQKEVTVRATFDNDEVHIAVIDTSAGFDPTGIAPEDVDELIRQRRTGGLGMRLIRTLVDEVRYEIEPGKCNELHMIKKVKPS